MPLMNLYIQLSIQLEYKPDAPTLTNIGTNIALAKFPAMPLRQIIYNDQYQLRLPH
jgi:hypothetical protein